MEEICRAVGAEGAVLLQGDVRTPDVPRTATARNQLKAVFSKTANHRQGELVALLCRFSSA